MEGRDDRIQLLRHGRRLWLWCRHLSGLGGDGRAVAAAGRAPRRSRHHHRRRRHLMPPPDQGRRRARSRSCRARAGDEPRQSEITNIRPIEGIVMAELMADPPRDAPRKILDAALAKGVEKKLKPLVITILDARGAVKVTAAQDGTS